MTIHDSRYASFHHAYLLTGSNMGSPQMMLQQAADAIEQNGLGSITNQSSLYQTAAWGKTDQSDFLNQALLLKTSLSPENLLTRLLNIEMRMGRRRFQKNDPRIIDIDIIFYDSLIIETEQLTIPHPLMHLRRFVLEPLHEMAPGFIHPVLKKSVAALLQSCPDPLHVHKFSAAL